jgi:TolA-binding protein
LAVRKSLLVLVGLQSACWVPKEVGKQMQDDILALRGDVQSVKKGLDETRATESEQMQAALKKIEEMSLALQEFNKSARMTDADFGTQMERMIRDVQELRGAVEVNEHRIGETETRLEQTLASRIQALQSQNPNDAAESASASTQSAAPKDKKELLAYGAKLAKDGKLNDARGVYRDVMRQWPKEPGITDEAAFRLGDSYFDEKKFDQAVREYIKVVDKFSTGGRVADAYFKIGQCSLEMGNLEDAQTFFTEVVTNHKKSPLAKTAKTKLDEVAKRIEQNRKKPPPKKK